MKSIILYLSAAAVIVSGCGQSGNNTPPPRVTGGIQLINRSSHPYYIYINGASYNILSSGKSRVVTERYGHYAIEVKQVSGYIFVPTDKTYEVDVTAEQNPIVIFPR
jgi:hypothetical protein